MSPSRHLQENPTSDLTARVWHDLPRARLFLVGPMMLSVQALAWALLGTGQIQQE